MAIDSIGPKIMLQNATEVAKDASTIQKHGDVTQSAVVKEVQTEAERMTDEIIDVYEPEHAVIQREKERREQEKRDRRRREETEEDEKAGKLPSVGLQEHKKIDIRV